MHVIDVTKEKRKKKKRRRRRKREEKEKKESNLNTSKITIVYTFMLRVSHEISNNPATLQYTFWLVSMRPVH